MKSRTKVLLIGLATVAIAGGIVAEQTKPPADPLLSARGALALTAAASIRAAAKDPASIEFVTMNVNNDATAACAEYHGKNSFNAKVKTFTVFVNGVGVTGNEQVWNKHCTTNMHDHMPLVR